jgi:uncharacterized membrane protein YhaH (DUF805 family)
LQTTRRGPDWPHLFFSSAGRLPRGPFAGAVAVVFAIFAAFDTLVSGPLRTFTAWLVFTLLFFSACCLLAKRLHDRGRSGWWTAVVIAGFLLAWPEPEGMAGGLALVILAFAGVDLLLAPGQRTANRFGPASHRLR